MRIVVNSVLCESNGRCMENAPEVFWLDDNDELHILVERPSLALMSSVLDAMRQCPKQALSIEGDWAAGP